MQFWSGFIPINGGGQIYPTLEAISPTPTLHLTRFMASFFPKQKKNYHKASVYSINPQFPIKYTFQSFSLFLYFYQKLGMYTKNGRRHISD